MCSPRENLLAPKLEHDSKHPDVQQGKAQKQPPNGILKQSDMREKRIALTTIKSNNFKIINILKCIFKNKIKISLLRETFFPYTSNSSVNIDLFQASLRFEQYVPEEIEHIFL